MKRFSFSVGLISWGLVLLAGCASPPFAPIAVPNNSTVFEKQEGPKPDQAKIEAELKTLQKVTPGDYLLKPGDSFAIVIDGQIEQSRPVVRIMPSGAISVPE